jgi:hypothetical protein
MDAIRWLVENRVLLISPSDDLSDDTMSQVSHSITAMIESGTAPIHIIFDIRRVSGFTSPAMRNLSGNLKDAINFFNNKRLGIVIYVTHKNHFMNIILGIISQSTHFTYKQVALPGEAITALLEHDQSLPVDMNLS